MPFFKVTDDDGNQFTYPAQKSLMTILSLITMEIPAAIFTGKQKQNMMTFCPVMTCRKNVEFFEYDDDDDDVDLDYGEFYGDDETTFDKIGLADDEDGDDADESW